MNLELLSDAAAHHEHYWLVSGACWLRWEALSVGMDLLRSNVAAAENEADDPLGSDGYRLRAGGCADSWTAYTGRANGLAIAVWKNVVDCLTAGGGCGGANRLGHRVFDIGT